MACKIRKLENEAANPVIKIQENVTGSLETPHIVEQL